MHNESATNKIAFAWVIVVFCLTQLAACSFVNHNIDVSNDGAPRFKVDVSKIPNATPKKESLSLYGNHPYRINGRRYVVLKSAKNYDKYGMASWYGSRFHGKLTSTREQYNLYAMTAASPTLPLPTYVKVTNLSNGKSIIVKVNDRGPFSNNRLIDLSYAAAEKLDFTEKGVTRVRVVAIDPDTWGKAKPIKPKYLAMNTKKVPLPKVIPPHLERKSSKIAVNLPSRNAKKSYLQIGAYESFASAQKLSQKIVKLIDVHTRIDKSDQNPNPIYRVQVGPLSDNEETNRIRNLLEEEGLGSISIIRG